MDKYIRTNDNEERVLDYDLLDIANRTNFLNDVQRLADDIELDLSDPDFSEAEKNQALNDAASLAVGSIYLDNAEIEGETHGWIIERIIRSLAHRYNVTLSEVI